MNWEWLHDEYLKLLAIYYHISLNREKLLQLRVTEAVTSEATRLWPFDGLRMMAKAQSHSEYNDTTTEASVFLIDSWYI